MTDLTTLLAGQTSLWLGLSLAAAIVLFVVLPILAAFAVYFAVFEDEAGAVEDVQRFIELRDEARRLMPPGLPLLDGAQTAAATAQIGQFQAKRDEARRALWPQTGDAGSIHGRDPAPRLGAPQQGARAA